MTGLTRRGLMTSAAGVAVALAGKAGAAVRKRRPRPMPEAHLSAGTDKGEWRTYGGDLASTRYSPLDQIGAGNFARLKPAFTFKGSEHGIPKDASFQATPLMVKGVLYFATGALRTCVAIDARTGRPLWTYYLDEGARGRAAPRQGGGHGVSYWTDGKVERILFVTIGYQLVSLDAATGKPASGFGTQGILDLKLEMDQDIPLDGAGKGNEIGLHSTPLVVGNVIVVGAAHSATTITQEHVKGYVRGFDVVSGKRLWIFHTVPKPGTLGYDTWGNGSADWSGNTGSWAQNSADPELGLVYLSIEQPTDDFFGAFRPGDNLFGDCIVALDARTGERIWYYQTVHHDVWDRDLASPAILCDINVRGRPIKALCMFAKSSLVFVLDRETGHPVWPIPEVPVPAGDVPGEYYAKTQPIPNRPPPCDYTGITVDDLIDFTPALRAEALEVMASYKMGPLFNPPIVSKWPGPLGAIHNPGGNGSVQWTGGSYDPETRMAYVYSGIDPLVVGLVPGKPGQTNLAYLQGSARADGGVTGRGVADDGPAAVAAQPAPITRARTTVQGMPYLKPPYGRITAYKLDTGDIAWQVAHGETPDVVRNNPALKGMTIPRTGNGFQVGTLVTRTLVIAGDGATTSTGPGGAPSGWLRAYDKASGREVGAIPVAGRASGCPMTYSLDGRQYIAVGLSDPANGQEAQLAVFTLA
jgi:quinoprotein glucose dehydrogenase